MIAVGICVLTKRLFEKSWQLLGECVGCAPNFGDRNEDIRNGFDRGAMGIGGFDNPGRQTGGRPRSIDVRGVPDFEKRWNQYARAVGDSWRVDEAYIKVKGQWVYLYRAVDKQGRTVDFLLSKRRDVATAKRFFSNAAKQHGPPRVITLDGYAASHRAVTATVTIRGIELAEKIKKINST